MKRELLKVGVLTFILTFGYFTLKGTHAQGIDCEELKKECETLRLDRDNLLTQTKHLLEYKNKALEVESASRKFTLEKEQLQRELEARLEENTLLQQKMEELQDMQTQLVQEKETLKNSLAKIQIEYKIVPETRREIARLQKENTKVLAQSRQLNQKIKHLEKKKLDADTQAEIYRRQLNDFKKQYEKALAKNRALEKKVAETPKRFAELARENKLLIKQTALMHYNLGVFYSKNKEYSRAIAEFEKTLELNPDDAYSHYNLGYIYAEYLVERPKAIEHFRHFLRLVKEEDKDVDWVKNISLPGRPGRARSQPNKKRRQDERGTGVFVKFIFGDEQFNHS